MRRIATTLAVGMLALGAAAGPAAAHEGHDEPVPLHGHLFVQRPTVEFLVDGPQGTGVYVTSFRRCVDLPAVPLTAHHAGLHTGNANDALMGRAGHGVLPAAPLSPYADCAAFEAALPARVGGGG